MSEPFLMIAVLLPLFGGALIPFLPWKNRRSMLAYAEGVVLLTSMLAFMLILNRPSGAFALFRFTGQLSISFRLDDVGSVYTGILAFLWPLSMLYAFEYMNGERHEKIFLLFYVATYGVTLGIAMAEDFVSLYFFYEMLTMATLPLIMHTLSREAIRAARTYLWYSLGGAAFAFIGMIFVLVYGETADFTPGGVLNAAALGDKISLLRLIYVICFCGFSVKAAMWPFCAWLPKASAAPTPVTALLHAVAVVKAGAFAVIRVTYFIFGPELLRGTWAQKMLMGAVIFSILYGCSRALKETHFKRRLAWSTVSNLSYILFGAVLMTPLGLMGALCHMVCHAVMKICSFLCAGAVIYRTKRIFIHELDGLGRKMPRVFFLFTVSGMALMGVPGLCGFVSKWYLAQAAVEDGGILPCLGLGALLVSALLTAIYMLSISVRAFFPGRDFDYESLRDVKDPGWRMLLPLCIFALSMLGIGLCPGLLTELMGDAVFSAF